MTSAASQSIPAERIGFFVAVVASVFMLLATIASAEEIPDGAKQEADTVWQQRCSTCHGPAGKGDGAAAVALNPKPRDFTSPDWQKTVTDDHIEKTIVEGGQGVGLSVLMAANPDLASKPDVVKSLRAHVRSLAAN
ncbi:MAG TPA: c-type cytochrome [Candidatus Binatia bacterium]